MRRMVKFLFAPFASVRRILMVVAFLAVLFGSYALERQQQQQQRMLTITRHYESMAFDCRRWKAWYLAAIQSGFPDLPDLDPKQRQSKAIEHLRKVERIERHIRVCEEFAKSPWLAKPEHTQECYQIKYEYEDDLDNSW